MYKIVMISFLMMNMLLAQTFDFNDFEEEFPTTEDKKLYDPLSGCNRIMTSFNDKFYIYILDPAAKGYKSIAPKEARVSIVHFFDNLLFPIRFVNNLLQLKFDSASKEVVRFGLNSTVGIAGLFDPSKDLFDLERNDEDFGQTLGFYGIGSGFHIVLPFLGPSNLRDAIGLYGDLWIDPLSGLKLINTVSAKFYKKVNDASLHIGEYESLKKDAVDLYPFFRDVYEQYRNKMIQE